VEEVAILGGGGGHVGWRRWHIEWRRWPYWVEEVAIPYWVEEVAILGGGGGILGGEAVLGGHIGYSTVAITAIQ
jgi:hypothetical protein